MLSHLIEQYKILLIKNFSTTTLRGNTGELGPYSHFVWKIYLSYSKTLLHRPFFAKTKHEI